MTLGKMLAEMVTDFLSRLSGVRRGQMGGQEENVHQATLPENISRAGDSHLPSAASFCATTSTPPLTHHGLIAFPTLRTRRPIRFSSPGYFPRSAGKSTYRPRPSLGSSLWYSSVATFFTCRPLSRMARVIP